MIRDTNNTCDLRRKTSLRDPMTFNNLRINLNDCMVIFVVFTVFLRSSNSVLMPLVLVDSLYKVSLISEIFSSISNKLFVNSFYTQEAVTIV